MKTRILQHFPPLPIPGLSCYDRICKIPAGRIGCGSGGSVTREAAGIIQSRAQLYLDETIK